MKECQQTLEEMREMATELPLSACEVIRSWEQRNDEMNEEELKRRPQEVLDEIDPLNAYRDRPWHGRVVGLRAVWIRRRILSLLDKLGVDVTPIMNHWDLWILAFCAWLEKHPMIDVDDMQHTEHAMRNFLGQVLFGRENPTIIPQKNRACSRKEGRSYGAQNPNSKSVTII